ncbi:MAG: methyltransferase domain-containing protein [Planctomycetota bacterium]|nr:methyltransferase domain-containing protein [Planctomycetota bacterium]
MTETPEYLLGTNDSELQRLEAQHGVWGDLARAALDRAGVGPGHCVLDLGAGPGFVSRDIAERVGPSGRVVGLDESPVWRAAFEARSYAAPVEFIESSIEAAELGEGQFDCVFSRWVFSFLGDLDQVLAKLWRALRPGGVLVIEDYNHEGVSVFPESAGFDAAIRATRAFYRGAGGDPWVAARLPGPLRRAGFALEEVRPHVRAGNGDSAVFRWLDAFFPTFVRTYEAQGLMTAAEVAAFDEEWRALGEDPDALLFSPMIVDVIARRPS